MALYQIFNGPMPTSAVQAKVAFTSTLLTLLQLKPFNVFKIVEWGISFDAVPAAPIQCELLDTGTIFGTVTASVDADIMKVDGAEGAVASVAGLTLATNGTGYTASGEGTIVATKVYDSRFVAAEQFVKQFPLGREPKCIIGNAVRIRIKAPQSGNALAYVTIEI